MEEEKVKEIQGGKRRRGLIKGRGSWVISQKERGTLIKEDIERRRRSLGRRGRRVSRIKIIKASWTRVLFDD